MTWIHDMRGASVRSVARDLGLRLAPPRGANGGSIYCCPLCGFERRHPSRGDRRGAIGIRRDDAGWRCHECDASGDAIDLAAVVFGGARYTDLRDDRARTNVREWCERFSGGVPDTRPRRKAAALPPPPAQYPPSAEVSALWRACFTVDTHLDACAYLAGRGLSAATIADRDLARVLPATGLPTWAGAWNSETHTFEKWCDTGHFVIVPLFDARGLMLSVLARSIERSSQRKSLAPSGFARGGLIMADPLGRRLLQRGAAPEWWPDDRELRVVITEGEIDMLSAATLSSDAAECAPATIGIVSGSWTNAIATRLPDGCTVLIATDNDEAGGKYARTIVDTLRERNVRLERCVL